MTLEIWAPQAVGISSHLITYLVISDGTYLQRLGQMDGKTKAFMDMLAAAKNATHFTP